MLNCYGSEPDEFYSTGHDRANEYKRIQEVGTRFRSQPNRAEPSLLQKRTTYNRVVPFHYLVCSLGNYFQILQILKPVLTRTFG